MLARSKSRQFALALALLPTLAIAGEPAESVADISAHDAAGGLYEADAIDGPGWNKGRRWPVFS